MSAVALEKLRAAATPARRPGEGRDPVPFTRYPKYKDSEIPWIGEIPADWTIRPLVGIACECDEPNTGMRESDLLSLSYGSIVPKDMTSNDGLLPESFETYQIVQPDDIVLRLTDLQNDKRSLRSAIVKEPGIITSAYLAIRSRNIEPSFLAYLLRSYDLTKVFYSMGGGLRQSMKFAEMKRLPVLVPSSEEQTAIAAFLDREIAKIDALIEEQEKLIALLKEKRQALISHAVTKGIDPNAPMKDSGIEWLGQVPAHWELKPLKYLVTLQSGGTPDKSNPDYWDGTIPWASAKDIKVEVLRDTEDHITDAAVVGGAASMAPAGAVVVVVRGMILARTFPVTLLANPMAINQDLKALRVANSAESRFLAWYLRGTANESLTRLDEAGHGTKALRMGSWSSLMIASPSVDEQCVIADYLEARMHQIDDLVIESEHAINLLKERRAALISAAVTGKIDVRQAA